MYALAKTSLLLVCFSALFAGCAAQRADRAERPVWYSSEVPPAPAGSGYRIPVPVVKDDPIYYGGSPYGHCVIARAQNNDIVCD